MKSDVPFKNLFTTDTYKRDNVKQNVNKETSVKVNEETSVKVNEPIHFCTTSNEAKDPCNAQWLMLYSYAAYASEKPDFDEKQRLIDFFENFPDQCSTGPIGNGFTSSIAQYPPRVDSRRDLLLWLCSIENRCRIAVGMKTRLCRYNELLKRWRYSDGYL